MNKKTLLPVFITLFILSVVFPLTTHAVYTPGCGGVAVTGITRSCNAIEQQCTSGQRATGANPATGIMCTDGSGDYYYDNYGSCVPDDNCVNPPPVITSFVGNPNPVVRGNSFTLTWNASSATSCTGSGISGGTDFNTGGATSGSVSVVATQSGSATYNLQCTGVNNKMTGSAVTMSITSPPFDASCSVNPTSAQVGQPVTWSALAWNGTSPYNFKWLGQIVEGLSGSSVSATYSTVGTKSASIQVTDSSPAPSGASVSTQDSKICTGATLAANITPGVQEDGGVFADMQRELQDFMAGAFGGGGSIFYNSSYQSVYDAVQANPQNYCVDGKLTQRCNPTVDWGGCNWGFKINIHDGTGVRDVTSSDQGPFVPNQNGIGLWNQARYFAAMTGTTVSGVRTPLTRTCSNTVNVSANAPTASLSANPVSINQGATSRLTWSSTNATSCTGTNFSTGGTPSGFIDVTPTATTDYSVTCTGAGGTSQPAQATVSVVPVQTQPDLTAGTVSPTSATAGTPVTLSGTATNIGNAASGSFPMLFQVQSPADLRNSAYITGLSASASAPGSISYTFPSAGTYQVRTCANYNTAWTAITSESDYSNNCGAWTSISVAAQAVAVPTCTISASPNTAPSTLTWSSTDATSCTGGGFGTGGATAGSATASSNGSYILSCTGAGGSCSSSVSVGSAACTNPTGTLTASPNRIRSGQSSTITYAATGITTSCTVTGPGVSQSIPAASCTVPTTGPVSTGALTTQSTYILTCDGVERARAIVNVVPRFVEF